MKALNTFLMIVVISGLLCTAAFARGRGGVAAETVTIEHFDQKGGNEAGLQAMIDNFMKKYPNIEVKLSIPPDAETVIATRLASGDFPDVLSHWGGSKYLSYLDEGYLMDLTDQDFVYKSAPAFLESTRIDGKLYCLPLAGNLFGFIYNTAIFEKHNLDVPESWDELISLLKALEKTGITPVAFADGAAWTFGHQTNCFYANMIPDWINTLIKIHKGELDVQDVPAFRQIAERFFELREYGQPDNLGADHVQSVIDFTAEKAAMILNGNWMMAEIRGAATEDFEFSMFPVPFENADDTLLLSGIDWALSIFE